MPLSASQSGAADFILPPEMIADELARVSAHPYHSAARSSSPYSPEDLGKLFVLIRYAFGNDLTCYKPSTIERRVERRMALHKIEDFRDYIKFCGMNATELHNLYKDTLISVTSFFRNPETFDALKTQVFPRLFDSKDKHASIRVWVPGCATGEEVYSIAMSLLEFLGAETQTTGIKIFGTDVDQAAIRHARQGFYSEAVAADILPERLARFFVKMDDGYRVTKPLRDIVVFSDHNLVQDPPFSRLNLVSCRNLLIYMQPIIQKKILRLFNYSLNPNAFLMLGTSETIGDSADLFSLVNRHCKIYSKKTVNLARLSTRHFGVFSPAALTVTKSTGVKPLSLQQVVDRAVLERYGPPAVVINENFEVLHFRGRTGPYLDPAPGTATFNILKLAHPDLHLDLRRVIGKALKEDTIVSADASLREAGGLRRFTLAVVPIREQETSARCFLVLFTNPVLPDTQNPKTSPEEVSPLSDSRTQEIERELAVTKEYLQTTMAELESTNVDLQSSNEELQSSNEELQSTNEELETATEELQSTNEELVTLNDERQNRISELSVVNDDLHNILMGVDSAVIIVNPDLRIRRFTHAAQRLLHLLPSDVGRPIGHLDSFVGGEDLESAVSTVIQTGHATEQEFLGADHHWYVQRLSPYKTSDNLVAGAILVFTDINLKKRNAEQTRDVVQYAAEYLFPIQHPLMIINDKLRVVWVNDSFHKFFQTVPEEIIGTLISDLGSGEWSDRKLLSLLETTLVSGAPFAGFKVDYPFPNIRAKAMLLSGSQLPKTISASALTLLSFEQPLVRART